MGRAGSKLSGALLLSSRRDMGILRRSKHALAYKLVNRLSDRVLAVSEEVKRFCIDADRIDPQTISVVYNGVDFRQIAAGLPRRIPLPPPHGQALPTSSHALGTSGK